MARSKKITKKKKHRLQALKKLPKVLPCEQRLILTYAEEDTIVDDYGIIQTQPLWKWLLQ